MPEVMATLLPPLMAEARAKRDGGGAVVNGAPLPASYREAVRFMAHRLYLRSSRYKDQQWRADTAGLDPDVFEFWKAFQRYMANCGIPAIADVAYRSRADEARAYVLSESDALPGSVFNTGRAIAVAHAIYGRDLPRVCWDMYAHAGREVAQRLGLGVQWGGYVAPWQWVVDP